MHEKATEKRLKSTRKPSEKGRFFSEKFFQKVSVLGGVSLGSFE